MLLLYRDTFYTLRALNATVNAEFYVISHDHETTRDLGRFAVRFTALQNIKMPAIVATAAGVLVFVLALLGDFLETRYVRAVRAWENGVDDARVSAARASVAMWVVGCVSLAAIIEVGWYLLPFEAAGLYAGTLLALRR